MVGWKYIKVFVSSTFIDMDVERDVLKNIVEPHINELLGKRSCSIEFIDLRHSVKTDASQSLLEREKQIFNICLDEIDNCRPYFMGIMGHRYGWIPAADGVPCPDLRMPEDFPIAKEDLSVTMYEFLHGVFSPDAPSDHSIIFLRDESSYDGLTEREKSKFVDEGEKERLVGRLRSFILSRKDSIKAVQYSLHPDSSDTQSLLNWTQMVASAIMDLIAPELEDLQAAPEKNFMAEQERYMQRYLRGFKGRKREIEEFKEELDNRGQMIVASRERGVGVTSFFCQLFDCYRKEQNNICLFYSDNTDNTFSVEEALHFWLLELDSFTETDFGPKIEEVALDFDSIVDLWNEMRDAITERGYKLYLFIESLSVQNRLSVLDHSDVHSVTTYLYEADYTFLEPMMYFVEPYDSDTLGDILSRFRPEVREVLGAKESVGYAKWLAFAIAILNNLNKLDFLEIRNRKEADNEERILRHQLELAERLPEGDDEIIGFWIDRLKSVFGNELMDNYLFLMSLNPEGWSEASLSGLLGCGLIELVTMRQMIGDSIIRRASDNGHWKIADSEMMERLTRNFSLKNFRQLISGTYDYVRNLNPDNRLYRQLVFKLAMLHGDVDFCAALIEADTNERSELYDSSREALQWCAEFYRFDYLNFVSLLTAQKKVASSSFFANLLEWIKPLRLLQLNEELMASLDRIISALRNLWFERKIGLGVYAVLEKALALKAEFYRAENDGALWEETVNDGLAFTSEYSMKEKAFLPFYFYFVCEKCRLMKDDPDEAYAWLKASFIPSELSGDFVLEEDQDVSYYAILLFEIAELMCLTGHDEYADEFCLKSFRLHFDFLNAVEEGKTDTPATPAHIKRNLIITLLLTLKLHFHFELLTFDDELKPLAEKIFDICGEAAYKADKDIIYEHYFKARALYIFHLDLPEEEIVKRLLDLANELIRGLGVEDSWKSWFMVREMNEQKISPVFESWLYASSLAMYLLSGMPDGKVRYDDSDGWFTGREPSENEREFVFFDDYAGRISYSLSFKETVEWLPPVKIWDSLVVFYQALLYREMNKEECDLQFMIGLHNSCLDLCYSIRKMDTTVRMDGFIENLDDISAFIEENVTPELAARLDFNAKFIPMGTV